MKHSYWFISALFFTVPLVNNCVDSDDRNLSSSNNGGSDAGANEGGEAGNKTTGGSTGGGGKTTEGGSSNTPQGGNGAGVGSPAGAAGEGGNPEPGANAGGAGGAPPLIGEGDAGAGPDDREIALWPMPNPVDSGLTYIESYSQLSAQVTLDKVTALAWQAQPDAKTHSWAEARSICANATTDGHKDWRLPTRIELISITDFSHKDPAIDSGAFPGTKADLYWTSTPATGFPGAYSVVDFSLGYVAADSDLSTYYVRCVRGGRAPTGERYTVSTGVVSDNYTGLHWEMPAPKTDDDLPTARKRCLDLVLGNHSDWRLPTIKELQTLVDTSRIDPVFDTSLFTDLTGDGAEMFWSSSTDLVGGGSTWLIQSSNGVPPADTEDQAHRARCVRSAI